MPDPSPEPDEPRQYAGPPSGEDPRLKIPEILTNPPPDAPRLAKPEPKTPSETLQMGRAWATAMDFVFTTLAGAALGWLFDRWRGTAPTGSVIGLGLGFVLAFVRIIRATQKQEAAEQAARKARKGP